MIGDFSVVVLTLLILTELFGISDNKGQFLWLYDLMRTLGIYNGRNENETYVMRRVQKKEMLSNADMVLGKQEH